MKIEVTIIGIIEKKKDTIKKVAHKIWIEIPPDGKNVPIQRERQREGERNSSNQVKSIMGRLRNI